MTGTGAACDVPALMGGTTGIAGVEAGVVRTAGSAAGMLGGVGRTGGTVAGDSGYPGATSGAVVAN
jgi:hypothetical protein